MEGAKAMKEYASNMYDVIENLAYDIDRFNIEVTENIPSLMDFVHTKVDTKESSEIFSSIGFIIGKGDGIFFDHVLRSVTDILTVVERKNRLLKNEVMQHNNFVYSYEAYQKLISICNEIDDESMENYHDIDENESIRTHHRKMYHKVNDHEYGGNSNCDTLQMMDVISDACMRIYNTIYNSYLKIYYASAKNTSMIMVKEIITCLLYAANFMSTIKVNC